jgi:hypothetical protein
MFWGYFLNEPTKSSLIGEKSPNLVTLSTDHWYRHFDTPSYFDNGVIILVIDTIAFIVLDDTQ